MTKIIGLTGSIAMGKSAASQQLKEMGYPISDADAIVHELFKSDADLKKALAKDFPESLNPSGEVDRKALGKIVFEDSKKLKQLESLLHPRVRAKHQENIAEAREQNAAAIILDIPLLFETGNEKLCDAVIVVSSPLELQRERALCREGMTEEKFEAILARQMPDSEKRKRANVVVDTSKSFEHSKAQLKEFMDSVILN
jgi:dephospho-CoA kinase